MEHAYFKAVKEYHLKGGSAAGGKAWYRCVVVFYLSIKISNSLYTKKILLTY
jgi:hypothetical protein